MSAIAITGMHRSGTSLIAKAMRLGGLYLGEDRDMIDPAPDNPEGFFEHAGFVHLNDDLLEATGGAWDHPPACVPLADDDPRVEHLRPLARELVASLDVETWWGWKDPRTCLTARFWLDLVPDLRFVICVRHPLEVALSLKRRNRSSYALGLSLWRTYYEALLAAVPVDRRVVTHYDAHFQDGTTELERLGRFAGIPAEALGAARAARNPGLRHHRVQLTLADAGTVEEIHVLYRQLCEEAGNPVEPEPPSRRAGVDRVALDLEAATEHLDQRRRQVASLEREREELVGRVTNLEAVVQDAAGFEPVNRRLDALEQALHDLRYSEERLDGRTDAGVIRSCRAVVRTKVPTGGRVLVVAKGDAALLDLYGRATSDFPQDVEGRYLGFSFADATAAIAHLEALRVDGHGYLLIPDTARWWLDHYPAFADHVLHRYEVISRTDEAVLVDLRTRRDPSDERSPALLDTVARLTSTIGRRPAILDWTEAGAARWLPAYTVFAPPDDSDALPYLDRSVDLVLVSNAARLDEARRVARAAIVTTMHDDERGLAVESVELIARDLSPQERELLVVVAAEDPDAAWLTALREAVDREPAAELMVSADVAAVITAARDVELLAFVEEGVLPLPGCFTATRAAMTGERVAAVGVKLLARDGSIEAAGASVFADGTSAGVAAGLHDLAAPWHDYVREACWGPGLLVMDATLVEKLADAWPGPVPVMHAAWSARLWAAGFRVLYQPDATAVRAVPAAPVDDEAREVLADAWKPALGSRPERPGVLDERSWRALLAREDVEAAWQ